MLIPPSPPKREGRRGRQDGKEEDRKEGKERKKERKEKVLKHLKGACYMTKFCHTSKCLHFAPLLECALELFTHFFLNML